MLFCYLQDFVMLRCFFEGCEVSFAGVRRLVSDCSKALLVFKGGAKLCFQCFEVFECITSNEKAQAYVEKVWASYFN